MPIVVKDDMDRKGGLSCEKNNPGLRISFGGKLKKIEHN